MSEYKIPSPVDPIRDLFKHNEVHEWVDKNKTPLETAMDHLVIIGGSLGMLLATHNGIYIPTGEPGDLDFICRTVEEAKAFLDELIDIRLDYDKAQYSLIVNKGTKFVPSMATHHFRFITRNWKPICVYVVPDAQSYNKLGFLVQIPEQIEAAREEVKRLREKWESEKGGDDRVDPFNPSAKNDMESVSTKKKKN